MKTTLISLACIFCLFTFSYGQTSEIKSSKVPSWTEDDRNYLLENLTRSKQEILEETKTLSKAQWNFKESADRWSINQVVEHIALWELLFMREISGALAMPPDSAFAYTIADSVFVKTPQSAQAKNALEATKPFSFAVPLGNNEGQHNVTWLMKMRDESIGYLKNETKNIRLQYYYCSGMNVHQYYIMMFGHADRHLRQIRKVKQHPKYPKK